MKLNQELIKRLTNGEIQLHNTGTVKQLNEILKTAFPDDAPSEGVSKFYFRRGDGDWNGYLRPKSLPIYTTEQFYEVKTERDWHNERPTAILSVATAQPQAKKFRLLWGLLEFEY